MWAFISDQPDWLARQSWGTARELLEGKPSSSLGGYNDILVTMWLHPDVL